MTISDFRELCVDDSNFYIIIKNANNKETLYRGYINNADDYFDCNIEGIDFYDNEFIIIVDYERGY